MSNVKVRFPPSPTGKLHLGNAYTFLFNYLFAKKNEGQIVLRFEDTDLERSKKEFEEDIIESLKWLSLFWDEGPIKESDRLDNYKKVAKKLVEEKKAYYCFCTTQELEAEKKAQQDKKLPIIYSGKCRNLDVITINRNSENKLPYVIRFKMPENRGIIKVNDLLHGEMDFDSKLLGDMVIVRSNGMPLYNFCVVIDDIDMKITHILRGEDHLSNTPKQVVLFEALDAPVPQIGHFPNILNSDRIGKLSKRQGATSVSDYRREGYLPEAIINYLALLGWTMPEEIEIMALRDMEQAFDIKKMRLSPAAFDIKKLDWINGEYIRMLSDEELEKRLDDYLVDHPKKGMLKPLVPLIKERMKKLSDFIPLTAFLFEGTEYDKKVFESIKIYDQKMVLEKIIETIESLKEPWEKEEFEGSLKDLAQELEISNREFFQLLRVAFSGQLVTPPLFETMKYIGEMEAKIRVKNAMKFLEEN